jgi:hypothetical protein
MTETPIRVVKKLAIGTASKQLDNLEEWVQGVIQQEAQANDQGYGKVYSLVIERVHALTFETLGPLDETDHPRIDKPMDYIIIKEENSKQDLMVMYGDPYAPELLDIAKSSKLFMLLVGNYMDYYHMWDWEIEKYINNPNRIKAKLYQAKRPAWIY